MLLRARLPVVGTSLLLISALASAQPAPNAAGTSLTAADYARAEKFLGRHREPAGRRRQRHRRVAARRSVHVSQHHRGRLGVPPRESAEEDARARVRSREARGHAVHGGGRDLRPEEAAVPDHRALGGRQDGLVRRRDQALVVRREGTRLPVDGCGEGRAARVPVGAAGGRAGPRTPRSPRPTARRRSSSRTGTSGCATWRPRRRRQLTTDGVKDFGYATDNAGWTSSDRAIVFWSPDSKKIATFQQDERKVGDMYLVETKAGHPALKCVEVPAARRHRRGDAASRGHRRRQRRHGALPDAARLPPRHARRQLLACAT